MDDDIRAEFDRTAEDGRGEGIVDNKRNTMGVGNAGEFFNIEQVNGRVGNRFTKNRPGIGLERGGKLLL